MDIVNDTRRPMCETGHSPGTRLALVLALAAGARSRVRSALAHRFVC